MKHAFFLILVYFLIFGEMTAQETSREITLEDIFKSHTFAPSGIRNITSMKDGEHYLRSENDSINIYSFKTGEKTGTLVNTKRLIPEGDSVPVSFSSFKISPDEKKILFATETERIYRRSYKSNYYIYSIDDQTIIPLSTHGKQQHAAFSPDGKQIAFVRENNMFLYHISEGTEKQITHDGEFNKIINGTADWVYEEEYGFSKAFFWSPDSRKIAFYRFNETDVKEFSMMMWGDLYPEPYTFKYPKAGEANSTIRILVYDVAEENVLDMNLGGESDFYIPRIQWTNDPDKLAIQWMNRLQNELKILLADVNNGSSEPIYHESGKYYIDITDNLTFLDDNEGFLLTSEQDGYNHIYLFDMLGNLEQQITSGEWDVDQLYGVDQENQVIYFSSSETSPLNRELYKIGINGSDKKMLSRKIGTNSANFSEGFRYYINTWSDANTPPLIEVYTAKGKLLRTLEDNHDLKNKADEYNFSMKEFFQFTTSDDVTLNGWMIKPPDFEPGKKYPVLMYVYGGPGSQTVTNSWGGTWYQYLARQGIIVASVDNRGTGGRGEEFKKMTYLQLGKYETIDQTEAAKYLGNLDYVDPERIGIWGWSYGGFMAANCITQSADVFAMAISVAPVTNWRYYDNIYTERFMRTPQENPQGYDNNSPINHVEKLKGDFLIIHGTADDNVHFQNTVDLVTALVDANKQFSVEFYPNNNHGIYTGKNTRIHLYTKMTDFIMTTLVKKNRRQ